ncbi:MAG: M20/M25/M40 family metallo-hydrolase [Planctomycetota bacterium]
MMNLKTATRVYGLFFLIFTLISWVILSSSVLRAQPDKNIEETVNQITAKELKKHVVFLTSPELAGREAGTAGGKKAAEYVAEEFKNIGLKTLGPDSSYFQEFSTRAMSNRGPLLEMSNVLGYIEGSDPILKKESLVIAAHFDHLGLGGPMSGSPGQLHPGADDNASGTAGLIELARAFTSLTEKPKRSILFIAFDGEEIRMAGSNHYVKNPLWPLDNTVSIINMDQIGRSTENGCFAFGAQSSPGSKEILTELNQNTSKINLAVVDMPGMGSDHSPFYENKIPYLHFMSGMNPDRHTPGDTIDKINADGMEKICRLIFRYALKIASTDQRPVYKEMAPGAMGQNQMDGSPDRMSMKRKPQLGIVPDFQGSEKGCKILEVKDDFPAALAGLQAGDIIIKIDKQAITRPQDLSALLETKKPEDEISVIVLRNAEEKIFKLILK